MLHEKLIIIGAGGHGRVVADIAEQVHRYKSIAFLDDVTPSDAFSYPFLGDTSKAENFIHEYDIFVAIGNSKARQKFMERLAQHGAIFPTLIHPNAVTVSYTHLDVYKRQGYAALNALSAGLGDKVREKTAPLLHVVI